LRCRFAPRRNRKTAPEGTVLVTKGHAGKITAIFEMASF
jgi:hypothetical protein